MPHQVPLTLSRILRIGIELACPHMSAGCCVD
jgi:hypothetical protein